MRNSIFKKYAKQRDLHILSIAPIMDQIHHAPWKPLKSSSNPSQAPLRHRPKLRDPQDMRDVLPYQANRLLAVAGAPVIRWCEGRFGISRRQWRLLAVLAEQGALLSSQLAEQAELDRVRTSRALQEMQAHGLITRSTEPGNARHVRVSITAAGREIYDGLWPLVRAHHLHLMSVLSAEQITQLEEMIDLLQAQAMHLHASYDNLPKANRRRGQAGRRTDQSKIAS